MQIALSKNSWLCTLFSVCDIEPVLGSRVGLPGSTSDTWWTHWGLVRGGQVREQNLILEAILSWECVFQVCRKWLCIGRLHQQCWLSKCLLFPGVLSDFLDFLSLTFSLSSEMQCRSQCRGWAGNKPQVDFFAVFICFNRQNNHVTNVYQDGSERGHYRVQSGHTPGWPHLQGLCQLWLGGHCHCHSDCACMQHIGYRKIILCKFR